MPPRGDPVPRARAALHWLGGLCVLGILGGLVVTAAAALWQDVDIQSLARHAAAVDHAPPPPPVEGEAPAAWVDRPLEVAMYANAATAEFFDDSTYLVTRLAEWERTLGRLGWNGKRISTPDELDALDPTTLLIAPEALCLATGEVEAIFRHLRRGGGVVANWALGARDARCRWRGWDTLRDFTGALDVVEYQAGDELFVTVPAGLPVSVGLPPGARIEFFADSHLGLITPGPRVYWSDWALNSVSTGGASAADAALALHRTSGGGRAVWFGFRPRQAARPLDRNRAERLLTNSLRWAAGLPSAEVSIWPEGRRAGILIAEDSESGFANAASLARVLREHDMQGTFFAVSRFALDHPELGDSLRLAGEVGSHTYDHVATAGLPLGEQHIRLARSRRELENWSDSEVVGLRPPEERFDEATLRGWLRATEGAAGTPYVAAVNSARSAGPEVHRLPEGPVVLLPRLMKDDYNVVVQEGTRRPERLLGAYLEGMRKIGALGGLAFVSLHTQIGGTPGQIGIVGTVLDTVAVARDTWWVATGADIARWWLDRDAMRLAMREAADGALEVEIRAPTGSAGRETWVEVMLPRGERIPFDGDRRLPFAPTEWGIRVPLAPLASGQARLLRLVVPADTLEAPGVPDPRGGL